MTDRSDADAELWRAEANNLEAAGQILSDAVDKLESTLSELSGMFGGDPKAKAFGDGYDEASQLIITGARQGVDVLSQLEDARQDAADSFEATEKHRPQLLRTQ